MRKSRLLTVIACLGALLMAPRALAAPLHLIAEHATAFISDGERYVAWETKGQRGIVVLDTLTGRQQRIFVPEKCMLSDANETEPGSEPTAADGRFLLSCPEAEPQGSASEAPAASAPTNPDGESPPPTTTTTTEQGTTSPEGAATGPSVVAESEPQSTERGAIFNARADTVRYLPADTNWQALGGLYVQGQNAASQQVVYAFGSGELEAELHQGVADLNIQSAPEAGEGCAGTAGEIRRSVNKTLKYPAYSAGVLARVVAGRGAIQLKRCDGQVTTLPRQPPRGYFVNPPAFLNLSSDVLSWDTGSAPNKAEEPGEVPHPKWAPALVNVYPLASHRVRSWVPPSNRRCEEGIACGFSAHTAHTVFWIASATFSNEIGANVTSASIYAAHF